MSMGFWDVGMFALRLSCGRKLYSADFLRRWPTTEPKCGSAVAVFSHIKADMYTRSLPSRSLGRHTNLEANRCKPM